MILKNEDKLKDSIREDNVDEEFAANLKTVAKFDEVIKQKKDEMAGLKKKTYVQARNGKSIGSDSGRLGSDLLV